MRQELEDLFKTINRSKAKNIIPDPDNRAEVLRLGKPRISSTYRSDNDVDGADDVERPQATHHGGSKVKGGEDSVEEDADNLERSAEAMVKGGSRRGASAPYHRHMRAEPPPPRRRRLLSLGDETKRARFDARVESNDDEDKMGSGADDGGSNIDRAVMQHSRRRRLLSLDDETKRARFDARVESNDDEDKMGSGADDGGSKMDRAVMQHSRRRRLLSLDDETKRARFDARVESNDDEDKMGSGADDGGSKMDREVMQHSRRRRSYEDDAKSDAAPSAQQSDEGKRSADHQDSFLNLKTQEGGDPGGSAKQLKAVNEELDEHNQRAIQLRNMDVKVGPQVAEVAKLIEQSRQKDANKDRGSLVSAGVGAGGGDASLEQRVNAPRKKADNENASPTLAKEERTKRSARHRRQRGDVVNATRDVDASLDLAHYLTGSGGKENSKVAYKPVVDWEAGDRERFQELQAHRKLNEYGFDNDANQRIAGSNAEGGEADVNNNVGIAEPRSIFDSGGEKETSSCLTSADESSVSGKDNPAAQRGKLFELLKISKDKFNNPEAAGNMDVDGRSALLQHLYKNQDAEEELVKQMEADKSDNNNNNGYVIRKRDLGDLSSWGDRRARVYYDRPYALDDFDARDSFHARAVPRYGQPTPDSFHKWNKPGDIHSFSRMLFRDLETHPTDTIQAGFDNEGNYVSPIALDRVRRLRQEKRRRRRRSARDELRERRARRANFLFPKADPIEEFFANRRAQRVEDAVNEDDDEYEGERSRHKRDKRGSRRPVQAAVDKRDDKGWPVTSANGATRRTPALMRATTAVALALFNLAHHAA